MNYRTLYFRNDCLHILDQTLLPHRVEYVQCRNHYQVHRAISTMQVRGAPAIGIAAAYGMALASRDLLKPNGFVPRNGKEAKEELERVAALLNEARPTAVNLRWATNRMLVYASLRLDDGIYDDHKLYTHMCQGAEDIYEQDVQSCRCIGQIGHKLIRDGMQVLTHCNAGALAASEMGTALAPLYVAHSHGVRFNVYVDETRPFLQGSRLTAWELMESGLTPILITDSCAASIMRDGRVDLVIVGADRIARNGDVVNKIGTYSLAVLCHFHKIPFYVAAPESTFDMRLNEGVSIPIEKRSSAEVTHIAGSLVAPADVSVYNPAFDLTPNSLITGIITERAIIKPVNEQTIEKHFSF